MRHRARMRHRETQRDTRERHKRDTRERHRETQSPHETQRDTERHSERHRERHRGPTSISFTSASRCATTFASFNDHVNVLTACVRAGSCRSLTALSSGVGASPTAVYLWCTQADQRVTAAGRGVAQTIEESRRRIDGYGLGWQQESHCARATPRALRQPGGDRLV